jgi:hypothetical protein
MIKDLTLKYVHQKGVAIFLGGKPDEEVGEGITIGYYTGREEHSGQFIICSKVVKLFGQQQQAQ